MTHIKITQDYYFDEDMTDDECGEIIESLSIAAYSSGVEAGADIDTVEMKAEFESGVEFEESREDC